MYRSDIFVHEADFTSDTIRQLHENCAVSFYFFDVANKTNVYTDKPYDERIRSIDSDLTFPGLFPWNMIVRVARREYERLFALSLGPKRKPCTIQRIVHQKDDWF